jgi:hypothetical protein
MDSYTDKVAIRRKCQRILRWSQNKPEGDIGKTVENWRG